MNQVEAILAPLLTRMVRFLKRKNVQAADPNLRRAGRAKTGSLPSQTVKDTDDGRRIQEPAATWQAARNKYFIDAAARVIKEQHITAEDLQSVGEASRESEPESELFAEDGPMNWDPENIPPWLSEAMERLDETHSKRFGPTFHHRGRAQDRDSQDEASGSADQLITRNQFPEHNAKDMLCGMEPHDCTKSSPAAPEKFLYSSESRLSSLRGIVQATGLMGSDAARGDAPNESGDSETGATFGSEADETSIGNGSRSRLSALRGLSLAQNMKDMRFAGDHSPLSGGEARWSGGISNRDHELNESPADGFGDHSSSSPNSSIPDQGRGKERTPEPEAAARNPEAIPWHKLSTRPIQQLPLDDVQILPSRPGQYRKQD